MPIAVSMAAGRPDVAQPYSRRWAQHQQPGFRVLLALDGQELNRDLLDRALECCVKLTERLDVLLVRPPKAPTFLLGGLLMRLERHGVDYRLTSAEGTLGDEVLGYLRRFHGIRTVVLDRHDKLPIQTLAQLLAGDYRLISLGETDPAPMCRARTTSQGLPVADHRRQSHQVPVIPPVRPVARAADAGPV
jgi:hypothetical protein